METSLNVLYDLSVLQLIYNVIHWILGINIIIFAVFEFIRLRKKNGAKDRGITAPVIFSANGLFFILYVLIGHFLYISHYDLNWLFEHEHYFHLATGTAFFLGGLIEVLHRRKILGSRNWKLGLPLGLVVGGSLFLHPQHGFGDVLDYMTIYHRILSIALIVAGVLLGLVSYIKLNTKRFKAIYPYVLIVVAFSGLVFLSYRHQYNSEALCRQSGKTHEIKLSKNGVKPSSLKTTLCDQIQFISTDKNEYHIMFDSGSNHSEHLGPNMLVVPKNGQPATMAVTMSGTFEYSEHFNTKIKGSITNNRPTDTKDWYIQKH